MNNLLLIDDHAVIRSGVKNVLLDIFKAEEVFEASNEETAISQLKARPYKLVIADIKMPGSQPFGLTEYIRAQYPDTRILIFSMNEEALYARKFLQAGAMGFVSKNSDLAELRRAIDLALKGRKYISESLNDQLIETLNEEQHPNPFEKLSKRELEIAILMKSGQSTQEIANTLAIAQSTVATFKSRIFEKLSVTNLVELIELANINGV